MGYNRYEAPISVTEDAEGVLIGARGLGALRNRIWVRDADVYLGRSV